MILHETLREKSLERDGQRIEALRPGKGLRLPHQRSAKRGLLEEAIKTLEDGAQGPGFEVLMDNTDERN